MAETTDCPRCHIPLHEIHEGSAYIDRCEKCQGAFFDQGEMFAALGQTADPSYWDQPGVAGPVRDGHVHCPRCHHHMLLQDVRHEGASTEHAEIDRCTHCGGIWLDAGEAAKILAIGTRMTDKVLAERRAAKAELDRMGDVSFSPPGLISRFLGLFKPV